MSDYTDATVEQLLTGAGSGDPTCVLLDELRDLGRAAPPVPSAGLAELLAGGCAPVAESGRSRVIGENTDRTSAVLAALPSAEVARRKHVGRLVAASVLVGAATLGLTGVAAAHDALPDPAQTVVRNVVNSITTFHIDHPPRRHDTLPPAPVGAAPAPGYRFDGTSALPKAQTPVMQSPRPATAPTPLVAAPKQRTSRGAALHGKRAARRAAAQQRARQRIKRHLRHYVLPGIWQPPTSPSSTSTSTSGYTPEPVAVSRTNRPVQGRPPTDVRLHDIRPVQGNARIARPDPIAVDNRSGKHDRVAKHDRVTKRERVGRRDRAAKHDRTGRHGVPVLDTPTGTTADRGIRSAT